MKLIIIVIMFSPFSKETDTLIIPHKSFFIASALSILLLDDLSLSDNPFPYKANNAKWDLTTDHHFCLKKALMFINLLLIK